VKPTKDVQGSYTFRLYIVAETQNSAQAIANITAICAKHLADHYEIEIVDVLREPERALAENIFMTPTLIKLKPIPILKIVGTLSQTLPVLQALGLEVARA
jgi:circadian clock protein KaiB